jgi:uncharacterized protein
MNHELTVAGLIGCVSLLYATAGQAGGTAFLAVMTFAVFPAAEMRATALLLNIVAAGYATWRLQQRGNIDRKMLLPLTAPSLVAAFLGGLYVLGGHAYFVLTGLLLVAAAALMVFKRITHYPCAAGDGRHRVRISLTPDGSGRPRGNRRSCFERIRHQSEH